MLYVGGHHPVAMYVLYQTPSIWGDIPQRVTW